MPDVPSKIYKQGVRSKMPPNAKVAYLHDSSLTSDFKNLTLSHGSIS
jgi:hypothetical protein